LIFWSTRPRTVIRKWSPCLLHKRDRWPAAEWKQYFAGWGGWGAYRHKIFELIIHQIFSLAHDWSKRVTWPNIPQVKLGNIREYSPCFQNWARCEKDLKNNKHNSLYLVRKYVRIFVLGHYLFVEAHSFPRTTLSENCSLLGTDNVRVTNVLAYFRAKWLLFIHAEKALGLSV